MTRVNRYIRNQYVPRKISRESMAREDTVALEDETLGIEAPSDNQHTGRRKSTSPLPGKAENLPADFFQAIRSSDTNPAAPVEGWQKFTVSVLSTTGNQSYRRTEWWL